MEILHEHLQTLEKDRRSYIVEGYPRTRVQTLKLQELGVVPDKVFILSRDEAASMQRLRTTIQAAPSSNPSGERKSLSAEQVEATAKNAMLEHDMYTTAQPTYIGT